MERPSFDRFRFRENLDAECCRVNSLFIRYALRAGASTAATGAGGAVNTRGGENRYTFVIRAPLGLRIYDQFAFHFIVPEAAEFRALEIVGAGFLGDEIDHLVGVLLHFAVCTRLVEHQAG